ncbi:MAG: c-type cytochrome domain-containing protein, partial [Planctomycetota bacterium]
MPVQLRFRWRWLANVLLISVLVPGFAFAQNEPTDADRKESRQLRRLNEQLSEIQVDYQRVSRRQAELKVHLKALQRMLKIQREIERIQQRIESLKEDDPRLDALDAEIKGFEEQLERQQWIREITDQSSELRELSEFIREISRERSLRSEPVRKRLAELIQDQTQLRRLVEQLDELEQQHDAAPVDQQLQEAEERKIQQVHQSIESIETRLDDGMQIVDALWEFAELLEREEEGDARRGSALKVWKSIQDDLQSAADLQSTDQGRQALDNGRASSSQPHQLQPIKIDASTLTLHRDRNFQRETVPLLRQYCFECHGSDSSLGDLDLEAMVSQEPLVVQRGKWINVIQQIKNRVMPPEDAELPNDQQREQIANVLHREIVLFDYSQEGVRQPG